MSDRDGPAEPAVATRTAAQAPPLAPPWDEQPDDPRGTWDEQPDDPNERVG